MKGILRARRLLGDKLFFSTEDLLDKKIVTDPYLYESLPFSIQGIAGTAVSRRLKKNF